MLAYTLVSIYLRVLDKLEELCSNKLSVCIKKNFVNILHSESCGKFIAKQAKGGNGI